MLCCAVLCCAVLRRQLQWDYGKEKATREQLHAKDRPQAGGSAGGGEDGCRLAGWLAGWRAGGLAGAPRPRDDRRVGRPFLPQLGRHRVIRDGRQPVVIAAAAAAAAAVLVVVVLEAPPRPRALPASAAPAAAAAAGRGARPTEQLQSETSQGKAPP
eukprot:SAG22_NODE_152_length_17377_cov_191.856928_4_plen_157_part_00